MPELTDPFEPLRRANPIEAFAMDAAHRDRMYASIVAAPAAIHRAPVFHGRRVKVAVVAVAVTLILLGVLVVRGGGTRGPLRTLSVSSVQSSTFGSTVGGSTHGGLPGHGHRGHGASPVTFVPGPLLSNATSSGDVYSFMTDPTTELSTVASALGIMNPQVVTGGNNGCGIGLSGESAKLFTDCNPTLEWYYNIDLPSCQGVTTTASGQVVPCPVAEGFLDSGASQGQLDDWSSPAAAALTPRGLTLGSENRASTLNHVTYQCELSGTPIVGCDLDFEFSNSGKLLYASGPLAPASPIADVGSYPLSSPRDAVSEVESSTPVYHGPQPSSSPVTVILTSSSAVYEVATLSDGTNVVLPAFSYAGSDGGTYTAIAVSPSLVTLSAHK